MSVNTGRGFGKFVTCSVSAFTKYKCSFRYSFSLYENKYIRTLATSVRVKTSVRLMQGTYGV